MEMEWKLLLRIVAMLFFIGIALAAAWIPFNSKKGWLTGP